MSDETEILVPNILDAAKAALDALWSFTPGRNGTAADADNAASNLRAAIAGYELQFSKSDVKLPFSVVDQSINYLLQKQHNLVHFREWLERNRALLESHMTRRYKALPMNRYSDCQGDLSIYGAERCLELAKALGGRWRKVVGHEGKHFDYQCAELPGLAMKCTINEAEPREMTPATALEMEVLS